MKRKRDRAQIFEVQLSTLGIHPDQHVRGFPLGLEELARMAGSVFHRKQASSAGREMRVFGLSNGISKTELCTSTTSTSTADGNSPQVRVHAWR